MHELALAQAIVSAAVGEAQRLGASRIREICARVREYSHHTEDISSLQFCVEAVAQGTIAEGAAVKVEFMPPNLRCRDCDFTFSSKESTLICPRCSGATLEEIDTEEVVLEDVVLE